MKYNEEFFHRYSYDEDNRLVKAETSLGDIFWDTDARYIYYPHGPLRRTEIGQDRLQGVDYTYTINGWLKAINSPNLVPSEDPWKDSYAQSEVVADEFSQVIGYHENDFTRTGPLMANAGNKYYLPTTKNLYNGNISTLTSKIGSSTDGNYQNTLTGNAYTYDRLNRVTGSDFKVFNTTAGNFGSTDNYHEDFKYDGNGNISKVTRNGFNSAVPNNSNAEMDKLVYDYYPNTNKLKMINETTPSPLNSKLQDLTQQVDENYVYDDAGYLIKDLGENLEFVWTYNGKISEMIPISSTAKPKPHVKFAYDAQGDRVIKQVNSEPFTKSGARQELAVAMTTTQYVRDAQGNIIAIYEAKSKVNSSKLVGSYMLIELPIYGSDRIGFFKPDLDYGNIPYSPPNLPKFIHRTLRNDYNRTIGGKAYELKDHLGNVRVVFSDVRSEVSAGGKEIDVKSYFSYYAFGAIQPGRNSSVRDYRFNFNGKEMDYEIGWQDYGMRIYRPDIGRFGSPDPIGSKFPMLSPYQFASNTPIWAVDLDGLEAVVYTVANDLTGHTFIQIDNAIYTYGRYNGTHPIFKNFRLPFGLNPYGDGVLVKLEGNAADDYLREQLDKGAMAFKITDVDKDKLFVEYQTWYNSSLKKPDPAKNKLNKYGVIVEDYELIDCNCTTTAVDKLKEAGSNIFESNEFVQTHPYGGGGQQIQSQQSFFKPSYLQDFLKEKSKFNSGVKDVTETKRQENVKPKGKTRTAGDGKTVQY
ncbi:MAG TPA: RHS repeat-associated core domain-containing protein [Cytophagaceae bacterium]